MLSRGASDRSHNSAKLSCALDKNCRNMGKAMWQVGPEWEMRWKLSSDDEANLQPIRGYHVASRVATVGPEKQRETFKRENNNFK
jgi:hypothetical protein